MKKDDINSEAHIYSFKISIYIYIHTYDKRLSYKEIIFSFRKVRGSCMSNTKGFLS